MPDPALESLLERLLRNGVEFVVIGGYAAVVHGSPMVTHDLDIGCDFSPDNLVRLAAALSGLAPVHRMTPKRTPVDLSQLPGAAFKNLYLSTTAGQLDCLSELIAIGTYPEMRANSSEFHTAWGPIRVLELDALIRTKRALGRPRDTEAVKILEAIKAKQEPGSRPPP